MSRKIANVLLFCSFALFACGDDDEVAPPVPRPDGSECSESMACEGDELCLAGRCHAPCTEDDQCARTETCDTEMGVCVGGASPGPILPDGGMDASSDDAGSDAGPMCPEECPAEAPVCDEDTGECVACISSDDCTTDGEVCDTARHLCVAADDHPCAACDAESTCTDGTVCAMDASGRSSCLQPCEAGMECAPGFACGEEDTHCQPVGTTCAAVDAAIRSETCEAAASCEDPDAPARATCSTAGDCTLSCTAESGCPLDLPCVEGTCDFPAGTE